jgi:two-component system sensor histidine kinase UhpB
LSLRSLLLASIVAVLLGALAIGGLLACLQARKSVRTEMDSALVGGTLVVHQSLQSEDRQPSAARFRALIRSFDGQRHLRAVLLIGGVQAAQSRPAPVSVAVPRWFAALINVPSTVATARISLPGQSPGSSPATLLLKSEPDNEIGEVWIQTRNAFAVLVILCGGISALICVIIGRTLRSITTLEAGLRTISDGHYETAVPEIGPPEFRALAAGFNRMAERLHVYVLRNAQLQDQLVKLQDEERAWIARDLHDEVGPYLFAIGVDAEAIPILAEAKRSSEMVQRADAICEAVAHIKRHIRAILRQLRPVQHLDFGLDSAVRDTIDFWQRRYPEMQFDLDLKLGHAEMTREIEEVAYRIVSEGISNAVRHARPKSVGISIVCLNGGRLKVDVVDDGNGLPIGPLRAGMGLDGMAARIRALHGNFEVGPRVAGSGVRITALLPLEKRATPMPVT